VLPPSGDPTTDRLITRCVIDRALELDEARRTRHGDRLADDLLTGIVEIWNTAHGDPPTDE
jgi:hypothetical protein